MTNNIDMKVYINEDGFYDTDEPCPKCGWFTDIVDYNDDSFECWCSQCKKTWHEKRLKKIKNGID